MTLKFETVQTQYSDSRAPIEFFFFLMTVWRYNSDSSELSLILFYLIIIFPLRCSFRIIHISHAAVSAKLSASHSFSRLNYTETSKIYIFYFTIHELCDLIKFHY